MIDHTRLTLLLDEDTRTACTQSPLRLKLAGHIAALQLKSGGLGHTRAVQLSPVRYLCSVMHSAAEPALRRLGKSLLPSIRDAHARVCELANIDPRNLDMRSPLGSSFPRDPATILTPQRERRSSTKLTKRLKLQGMIMARINDLNRQKLRALAATEGGLDKDTALHILAITANSSIWRIFTAPLCDPKNRVDALLFARFVTMHLALAPPVLLHNPEKAADYETPLERCTAITAPLKRYWTPSATTEQAA